MTNLQLWSIVVGFFLPPVQAIIQQQSFSTQLRAGINFVACAVAAVGVTYFQGDLTGRRFIEAGLVILVTTIATYSGTWKPTGIAPGIEKATSFGGKP